MQTVVSKNSEGRKFKKIRVAKARRISKSQFKGKSSKISESIIVELGLGISPASRRKAAAKQI